MSIVSNQKDSTEEINEKWVNNVNSKILLVDDEKDIVNLIEDVLRQDGFQSIQKASYLCQAKVPFPQKRQVGYPL